MSSGSPFPIPSLSIVIPFYNDAAHIRKCLDSIKTSMDRLQNHDKKPEIIVIDDHSPVPFDPAWSTLPVKVHRFSQNKGVGSARNKGASLAHSTHILFLDSDVILDEHHLPRLYGYLSENTHPVIQGPTSVIPANEKPGLFHHYLAVSWNYYEHQNWTISLFTQCFCIEKRFFKKLGGFSEHYKRSGGEEFELGLRLCHTNEAAIRFEPELVHFHHFDGPVKRLKKAYFRSRHIREIALDMPDLPFRFTAQALMRSAFSWAMNLSVFLALIKPAEGITTFLVSALLFYLSDDSLTGQMTHKHSIRLSIASVFFRQLEFTFINFGLIRGLADRRKHGRTV